MAQELSPKISPKLPSLPAPSHADPDPIWHQFSQWLSVNTKFLKMGLVLIKENKMMNKKVHQQMQQPIIGTDYFFVNERMFYMGSPNKEKIIEDSKLADGPTPDARSVHRTSDLLEKLATFAGEGVCFYKDNPIIFNSKRREEIFPSLTIDGSGIYVFPWLSRNDREFESNKSKFSGFNHFVTAGCLFGSSMRGEDQHGCHFQIFKHDIQFFPGQKIERIIFDEEGRNPYEEMLFKEFEFFVKIMSKFSNPQEPKRLLHHLPCYDYVLFGIELFIRGRITLQSLDSLFQDTFSTGVRHTKKINAICDQYGFTATISSPFENLFVSLDTENKLLRK